MLLTLALAACGPRLQLRRETPPGLDTQNITTVSVMGVTPQAGPNVLQTLIDPMSGLAAAALEPEVVHQVEQRLAQRCALNVVNRCSTPPCPGSEGTLAIQLTEVSARGGTPPVSGTQGAAATVTTRATFSLTRADGAPVFSQSYFGRRSGPTPTVDARNGSNNYAEALMSVPLAARLAQQALFAMIDAFVADLIPGQTTDTLLLEDPEPLKPAVKAATDGNLAGSIQLHQTYLQTNPNDGRAWSNLGAIYSVQGQFQDAIAAYERAAQLGGNERFAQEVQAARTRLAQLQYLSARRRVACGAPAR
ncbi:MAG: tetratricopeptide repeat protein [Myxococcaceae bacterium]|nr:tetratricopeptide repeat protein [Myxococcaceae bacterium]